MRGCPTAQLVRTINRVSNWARSYICNAASNNDNGPVAALERPLPLFDQVVVLPDGADAKAWYVSLSLARDSMHVYTRDKGALRQSVMYPGERKSVWELMQALQRSKPQPRNRLMPDLWATRQAQIVREIGMER